jgi:acetyl-CoA decarbonylase/synthase complex subunit delta
MAFTPKTAPFSGKINAVTLGTGDKAIVVGGQNVMPFYSFDAPIENAPKVGLEISDLASQWELASLKEFYAGCATMADYAKKAEAVEECDFICLNFVGADPNGADRSVADCVADAKAVAEVVTKPIVVMGCKNVEKDSELLAALGEALVGKNVLVMSAKNENYKTIGASVALASGQKIGAETADDINLAKQLNIMLKGLNVNCANVVMDIGTAAVGYGYEYAASTMDRIRLAALQQSDADLQMPILAAVCNDTWGVKESTATAEDEPAWGCQEERAISMEIATAAADLVGGADLVVLRHPASAATIKKFITELV